MHQQEYLEQELDRIFSLLGGSFINKGSYRAVYDLGNGDVLKVANDSHDSLDSNLSELEIWNAAKGTPAEEFLVPVVEGTHDGKYIIMKKTQPISRLDEIPDRVPDWMADIKPRNWGVLDGKVVCHDYGNHFCIDKAIEKFKLVKADKWNPDDK